MNRRFRGRTKATGAHKKGRHCLAVPMFFWEDGWNGWTVATRNAGDVENMCGFEALPALKNGNTVI
jgi:hypothetical protein